MFNTKVLVDLLTYHPKHDDFGGDIIPEAIHSHQVYGYDFDGYWQDIGTIRSFYETNLALTTAKSAFNFNDPKFPIYTAALFLPGSIVENSELKDVLLTEGCRILGAKIEHSIIGIRSQIATGVRIKDTIIMGADYYPSEKNMTVIPMGIGANCQIEGAILDKNARIGENVIIRPFPRNVELDRGNWFVREGIVVVPKDAEILPGTQIGP